ncbi:MAG: DUF6551 family protein [Pseudomonadota bacterium]
MAGRKFNEPIGTLPVLQYLTPGQLQIDTNYQRSLEGSSSERLINAIAYDWNWKLCLPLVVARRPNGELFVIDGQHRLAAANLRGDIQVLPCVVIDGGDVESEAQTFVHLNKQRRPLSKLDVFKAAVASGDTQACAIDEAIRRAGLAIAATSSYHSWKPGQIINIGGIEAAWREHGPFAASLALEVMGKAFNGQVLKFAGSIYPGIASITAEGESFDFIEELVTMVACKSQEDWRKAILLHHAEHPGVSIKSAAVVVLGDAWDETLGALLSELEEAA